jgi:hypothetical protein
MDSSGLAGYAALIYGTDAITREVRLDRVHSLRCVKFDKVVDQGHANQFEKATRALVGLLRDCDHHGRQRADRRV